MKNCMPLFGMVCLKREKCENFLRIKRDWKGRSVACFTFIRLYKLLCTSVFKGVPLSILPLKGSSNDHTWSICPYSQYTTISQLPVDTELLGTT